MTRVQTVVRVIDRTSTRSAVIPAQSHVDVSWDRTSHRGHASHPAQVSAQVLTIGVVGLGYVGLPAVLSRHRQSDLGSDCPLSVEHHLRQSERLSESGTAVDDRRLSFYALQRGQVVGVSEAVVCTQLPDKWTDVFHQRLRWSKSAWLGIPFVLTNLRWLVVLFYMIPLVFSLPWPLVVAVLVVVTVRFHSMALVHGVLFWEVCAITQTWIYAAYRPGLAPRQRSRSSCSARSIRCWGWSS